jgi:molybdopterin/thiamine biosynthesis adenylyltransferase
MAEGDDPNLRSSKWSMFEPTEAMPSGEITIPPEFARIADSVNVPLLATQLVVIIGVGTVGSQIALLLANSGVGDLRLIDGDKLEESNLIRHALLSRHIGMNKAEALVVHLTEERSTLRAEALPRDIDDTLSDRELDELLGDADLIVAATDKRDVQRRLGRRALALDIPAIFPALYGSEGGEVFVQLDASSPCFLCWDDFRPEGESPRGVTALNADTLGLLGLAVQLIIGMLDEDSEHASLLAERPGDESLPQLFVRNRFALRIGPVDRRANCPSCAVGPSPLVVTPTPASISTPRVGSVPSQTSRNTPNSDIEGLRRQAWDTLVLELKLIAVLILISAVIIAAHIRQATAVGFVLSLGLLGCFIVLCMNTADCMSAWREYRLARSRSVRS